ncbi:MAG: hypothetical protein ABIC04_02575 [Nanoarchaeota archaeon]
MTETKYILIKEQINRSNTPIFSSNMSVKNADWAVDASIPLSVFNESLSGLETITKYLKEEFGLGFRQIALILNRDERTIWGAYSGCRNKMEEKLPVHYSKYYIPISIFRNRELSVLELITEYLKENVHLRYCQIASCLKRDDRTVWTAYQRARKKRRKNAE